MQNIFQLQFCLFILAVLGTFSSSQGGSGLCVGCDKQLTQSEGTFVNHSLLRGHHSHCLCAPCHKILKRVRQNCGTCGQPFVSFAYSERKVTNEKQSMSDDSPPEKRVKLTPVAGFNYDLCALTRESDKLLVLTKFDRNSNAYKKLGELSVGPDYSTYVTEYSMYVLCRHPDGGDKSALFILWENGDISKRDIPRKFNPGCAVFIKDSNFFVAGGIDGGTATREMYEYSISTRQLCPSCPLTLGRAHFNIVKVGEQEFYAIGGHDGSGNLVDGIEKLDFRNTLAWEYYDSVAEDKRKSHAAAIFIGGHIWIAGGKDSTKNYTDTVNIIDLSNKTWEERTGRMNYIWENPRLVQRSYNNVTYIFALGGRIIDKQTQKPVEGAQSIAGEKAPADKRTNQVWEVLSPTSTA